MFSFVLLRFGVVCFVVVMMFVALLLGFGSWLLLPVVVEGYFLFDSSIRFNLFRNCIIAKLLKLTIAGCE